MADVDEGLFSGFLCVSMREREEKESETSIYKKNPVAKREGERDRE